MRDKEMNDQLLKSISFDLKEWEKQAILLLRLAAPWLRTRSE